MTKRLEEAFAAASKLRESEQEILAELLLGKLSNDQGKSLTIALPADLIEALGTEEEARREATTALILDLVRRGKISRARAAELLQISLWDFPAFLAQYQIPWFDYPAETLREDLKALAVQPPRPSK